jgi:hypothetical protein
MLKCVMFMWLYMYTHILLYILSLLLPRVFLTFSGWDRPSMLWFVGQQCPVEITLRVVLIYLVVVLLLYSLRCSWLCWCCGFRFFFCFLILIINCGFLVNCCGVAAGVSRMSEWLSEWDSLYRLRQLHHSNSQVCNKVKESKAIPVTGL